MALICTHTDIYILYVCVIHTGEVALTALRCIALYLTTKNRNTKIQGDEADMDIPFILSQNTVSYIIYYTKFLDTIFF